MKMTKMKRSMKKIVQCGLVVCALCALVLLSGCKGAKLEAGEKRLVSASLGGGELRSGRSRRAVASGHASAQPVYYESKFRVKLKPKGGVEKCLSYDPKNAAKGAYFTECDENDTKQVWYQDYNAKVFSLHGGKKYCPDVIAPPGLSKNKKWNSEGMYLGVSEAQCAGNDYENMWYVVKLSEAEHKKLKLSKNSKRIYKIDGYNPSLAKFSKKNTDGIHVGYWSVYTRAYKNMRGGAPYVVYHSSKAQSIVDKKGFEPIELEFVKDAVGFFQHQNDYFPTYVFNEKKALPFFVNKKTGKHVYIEKDVFLRDLLGYQFLVETLAYREPGEIAKSAKLETRDEYNITINSDTKLEDLAFNSTQRFWEIRKDFENAKTKPYYYRLCVFNRDNQLVGGKCTQSFPNAQGSSVPILKKQHVFVKKPSNYAYNDILAFKPASYYEFKSDGYEEAAKKDGSKWELKRRAEYVDANKFWQADNVLLTGDAKKSAWSVNTSYVQRGKVRSVLLALPFFTTDEIKANTDYKIEFSTENREIGIDDKIYSSGRMQGAFGYVQLRRGSEKDSEGRMNAEVSFYIRKGTTYNCDVPEYESCDRPTYERVNKIEIPLVAKTDTLTGMPVFLLLVDIEAKKALVALGTNDWNSYGQTDIDKNAVKVLDLTRYVVNTENLSSSFHMGTHYTPYRGDRKKPSMRFYRPRVLAGLDVSLKDVPISGSGHSRGKRALSDACRFAVEGSWIGNKGDSLWNRIGTFTTHLGWAALDVATAGVPCMAYIGKKLSKKEEKKGDSSETHYGGSRKVDIAGVEDKNTRAKTKVGRKHGEFLERDEAAFFIVREVGQQSWEEICDLKSNSYSCTGSLGGGAYEDTSVRFHRHVGRDDSVDVSLACFSHREKVGGQEYNYLCVTDNENIQSVDVTVINRKETKILKSFAKSNGIRFFVPSNQKVEDIEVYINQKRRHDVHPKQYEYRLGAKLRSILTLAKTVMKYINIAGEIVTITQNLDNTLRHDPPSSRGQFKNRVNVDAHGRLVYKEKRDDEVWFTCPPAVPAGSIYRCEASRLGLYRVSGSNRILRNAVTSDGVTNERTELYPQSNDFNAGTAYWQGDTENDDSEDYQETEETPRNYVDVWFDKQRPNISLVEFKVQLKEKEVIIQKPVGVVKVRLDSAYATLEDDYDTSATGAKVKSISGYTGKYIELEDSTADETPFISFNTTNVRLVPPAGHEDYVKYFRQGFMQTADSEIYTTAFYNQTSKKYYTIDIDALAVSKSKRSFKQYGDVNARVYPYLDGSWDILEGRFYTSGIKRIPSVFFGSMTSEELRDITAHSRVIDGKKRHVYYYMGRVPQVRIAITDAPVDYSLIAGTSIDSNIDGARPYQYTRNTHFTTAFVVTVSDIGEYNFTSRNLSTEPPVFTKLFEIKWKNIQTVGYDNVKDIGNYKKAKLINFIYRVKGVDEVGSEIWSNDYKELKSTRDRVLFRQLKRNGERVMYYNMSIGAAQQKKILSQSDLVKSHDYIKTHWKEVTTPSRHDELR